MQRDRPGRARPIHALRLRDAVTRCGRIPGGRAPASGSGHERRWRPEYDACAYLVLVGLFSFGAYTLLRCGVIGIMRYELLSVIGATGLAAWYLRVERVRALAAIWMVLMIAWATSTFTAHARLWAEYLTHPPAGVKQIVIRELEASGVHYGYADYWLAYYITFLTNERVVIHATEASRIGQSRDDVEKLEHRSRPAMRQQQRQWPRPIALHMQEVQVDTVGSLNSTGPISVNSRA